ncbi:MAG: response regulator transcription factor [Chloroflexota bacterium]|nr:response regulator transcription factor [Chloroflexota bacterium]
MRTRLMLVEDHILVRQSIRAFLENAGFTIIGEASTGHEALEMAIAYKPDLIIMDIHLPEMNGIEATQHIRRHSPDIRIIALTAYNEKAYYRALSNVGIDGFVLKTAELSELLEAIRRVLADEKTRLPALATPQPLLTERELQVLTCAGYGWTNKQIGIHLKISDRTVQVHLHTIYEKLQVANRTEAVLHALSLGIIVPMERDS